MKLNQQKLKHKKENKIKKIQKINKETQRKNKKRDPNQVVMLIEWNLELKQLRKILILSNLKTLKEPMELKDWILPITYSSLTIQQLLMI